MIRAPLIGFVALTVWASVVHAQSTARLGEASRPLRVELSVGMIPEQEHAHRAGTVNSAAVAVRWTPSSIGGIRATLNGIRRHAEYLQDYGYGVGYDSVKTEHRVLALTIDTDVSFRVWRDLTISPSVGAGFTPYVFGRSSTVHVGGTPDMMPSDYRNYSRSDFGVIWTLGLAVRYRHLVIERQAIGLLGAGLTVQYGREYYPWTIGYRF